MKKADMTFIAQEIAVHAQSLANVSTQLAHTFDDVSRGHKLEVSGDEYKCSTHAAQSRTKGLLIFYCFFNYYFYFSKIPRPTDIPSPTERAGAILAASIHPKILLWSDLGGIYSRFLLLQSLLIWHLESIQNLNAT